MPLLEKLLEGKITEYLARPPYSGLGEAHRRPVSECKGLSENTFCLSRQYLALPYSSVTWIIRDTSRETRGSRMRACTSSALTEGPLVALARGIDPRRDLPAEPRAEPLEGSAGELLGGASDRARTGGRRVPSRAAGRAAAARGLGVIRATAGSRRPRPKDTAPAALPLVRTNPRFQRRRNATTFSGGLCSRSFSRRS